MVQVHREDGLGEDLVGSADDVLEHQLIGVAARALGNLDNEGSLALDAAPEEAHALLHVIDVVSADGILAIRVLEQFLRRNDHR